jgi:uncharacterized protein involved in exopolysaccharide biosynthesis
MPSRSFLVTALCATLMAALLFLGANPPTYCAATIVQLTPSADAARSPDRWVTSPEYRLFAAAQLRIICSAEVLVPTIKQLGLRERWSNGSELLTMEAASNRLLRAMRLRALRNTNTVEINVFDVDPVRAADIANALAVQYRDLSRNSHVLGRNTTAPARVDIIEEAAPPPRQRRWWNSRAYCLPALLRDQTYP